MRTTLLLSGLLCLGCSEENDTADPLVDTGPCAETPLVTYANFGRGFMLEYCQGCHGSTTLNRHGAPGEGDPGGGVFFDTAEQAWDQAGRVLVRALEGTMPPGGGATEDDLMRLEWWLTCGEEGL